MLKSIFFNFFNKNRQKFINLKIRSFYTVLK